jgi:hypothetical protein
MLKRKDSTMSDKGILDLNVDDAVELQVLPEDEYELRIISGEIKISQAGNKYLALRFEVLDQEFADDIYHNVTLPSGEDKKTDNKRLLSIKSFYNAFGISGQVDLSSLPGLTGRALLVIEEDQTYGERNKVKRFLPQR